MNSSMSDLLFSAKVAAFSDGRASPDWSLLERYDLLREKKELLWQDRFYRRMRSFLSMLGLGAPYVSRYDWSPALKHVPRQEANRVLLISAVGVGDRNVQRAACIALRDALLGYPQFFPVLLTDCADFSFFSRLGWQVEYLPELDGEGDSYTSRKSTYLAWRYRDGLVLPLEKDAVTRFGELADEYLTGGPRK